VAVTRYNKLVVALLSQALFDFEDENRVNEEQSDAAYMAMQLDRLESVERRNLSGQVFGYVCR
jgi:5'-nucleotidase